MGVYVWWVCMGVYVWCVFMGVCVCVCVWCVYGCVCVVCVHGCVCMCRHERWFGFERQMSAMVMSCNHACCFISFCVLLLSVYLSVCLFVFRHYSILSCPFVFFCFSFFLSFFSPDLKSVV